MHRVALRALLLLSISVGSCGGGDLAVAASVDENLCVES